MWPMSTGSMRTRWGNGSDSTRSIRKARSTGRVLEEAGQERELQQLRRRIRELEVENDFLKKVSAYFAKNPQ